jgi:hypothetical protein
MSESGAQSAALEESCEEWRLFMDGRTEFSHGAKHVSPLRSNPFAVLSPLMKRPWWLSNRSLLALSI